MANPTLRDLVALADCLGVHPNAISEDDWREWTPFNNLHAPLEVSGVLWFGRCETTVELPGRRLAERRAARGITLRTLEATTGVSRSVLSRLEQGTPTARIRELSNCAIALDCEDLEQILGN